jgi:hypothetical protein
VSRQKDVSHDQFSKEGLKPQLSNSPFEKRGIKGDFSATSAAAIVAFS